MLVDADIVPVRRPDRRLRKGGQSPAFVCDPEVLAANLAFGFDPFNENAHPFLMMRSALLRHARNTGQYVFAVTSAEPGNGKTHVAVNLAAALSRIHPTVLIECDLRSPSIRRRLGMPAALLGMDDYLAGEAEWSECGVACTGFGLAIHSVRKAHADAELLLGSPRLVDCLQQATGGGERRTICIVDTPPALVNDDVMLIARAVDGIVMVVQEARTRKRDLQDALQALGPGRIVGSVLNMAISAPATGSRYGYYGTAADETST